VIEDHSGGVTMPSLWSRLLLSLSLCAAMAAQAAQVYRVGVEELKYYPVYEDDHGEYIGYARELLDAFAKSQGIVFKYVPLPVNRLFKTFISPQGNLDFKFPDNPYWQAGLKTPVHIVYSDPVLAYIDGVMVRPEDKGRGLPALRALGTIAGFTPERYRKLIQAGQIRLEEFSNFSGLLQQAINKRLNGAYINVAIARYQLRDVIRAPDALVFDPDLPYTESGYYLSTIKHPDVIGKLNQFLREHANEVNALKRKYQVGVER